MVIDQISVFVENSKGRISEITGILSENNIDIRALSIADTTNFGILRLIVNDPRKAQQALKDGGFTVNITNVIAVKVTDKPGMLHKILLMLSEEGISVEYVYAFITRSHDNAYVIIRVEDNDKAIEVLKKNSVEFLKPEEVYSI